MSTEITLDGFDDLIKILEGMEDAFIPLATQAIAESLQAIYEQISPYPPQPDRMRSGKLNTYVRGQGFYPRSAFIPDMSAPGGFRTRKVKKAQIRLVSEQMDKKWRMQVISGKDNIQGILRNEASYSGWVSGPQEGDPHQLPYHAETGWPNVDDSISAAMPQINKSIDLAIEKVIKL